jgi:NADH dehydrogenase
MEARPLDARSRAARADDHAEDQPAHSPDVVRPARVVIIGAGFAGLNAVRALRRTELEVTLVDRHNYHLFQPLLYQVATAALEPADISGPLRQLVRASNVKVLLGDVQDIDTGARIVRLAQRSLPYDYLILATGSTHSYFGHDEWALRAPGLKTLEDALEIRRRILYAYEAAENEPDPELRKAWLTFVVIGAGPTGVELAGALAEIARQTRARDFKNIDPRRAQILLLEGLPRVLAQYPERLSQRARRSLERLGVEVRTDTMVTEVGDGFVRSTNCTIETRTVLWGAGVAASPLARALGAPLDKAGRVRVTSQLTLPDHPEIFVAGDLAYLEQEGHALPGLAPVAIAQGKHAARNVLRAARGEALEPFRYHDRGSFAVIGRGHAVGVAFKKLMLDGVLAWLAWLLIHIAFLVGFRNRVSVLLNWAYVYFTRRRYAQIIVGPLPVSDETGQPHPLPAGNGAERPTPSRRLDEVAHPS